MSSKIEPSIEELQAQIKAYEERIQNLESAMRSAGIFIQEGMRASAIERLQKALRGEQW